MKIRRSRRKEQVAVLFTGKKEVNATQDFLQKVHSGDELEYVGKITEGRRLMTQEERGAFADFVKGLFLKNSRSIAVNVDETPVELQSVRLVFNVGGHWERKVEKGEFVTTTHPVMVGGINLDLVPTDFQSNKIVWWIRDQIFSELAKIYFARTIRKGQRIEGFLLRIEKHKPENIN